MTTSGGTAGEQGRSEEPRQEDPHLVPGSPLQRREPTTTHDPFHAGSPRLALEQESYLGDERQTVFYLVGDVTTIGSDPEQDLCLPGLEAAHAVVRRDDQDEFTLCSDGPEVRVHGRPTRAQLLRSGARIEVGPHVLAFYRDEHADHGRPFAGREGGEIGRQRSQPSRRAQDSGDD